MQMQTCVYCNDMCTCQSLLLSGLNVKAEPFFPTEVGEPEKF